MEENKYELSGEVVDLAFKFTQKGDEYAEVTIAADNSTSDYPPKARTFDSVLVGELHGASRAYQITVAVVEKPGTYQGKDIVYKNIVGIQSLTAPQAVGGKPSPAPQAQVAKPSSVDENQMRIMRQSTLGYSATLHSGKDFASPEIMIEQTIQVASKLLEYVISGEMPSFVDEAAEQEKYDEQIKEDLFGKSGVQKI